MSELQKLENLRKLMIENGLDCYFITMSDPHLSEYVADHWRVINWLSGFTGSTGNLVITQNFAGLWTDSRYFLQAEDQLKGSGIELVRLKIPHQPEFIDWLYENLPKGSKIGFNGELVSVNLVKMMQEKLKKKELELRPEVDLISGIWTDRPGLPAGEVFFHDLKYAGMLTSEKILKVQQHLKELSADALVLSSPEDIAWLYNIRGNDIPYVPVVLAYSVITEHRAILFIEDYKINEITKKGLIQKRIEVFPYSGIFIFFNDATDQQKVLVQHSKTNYKLFQSFPKNFELQDCTNITTILKSVKNQIEIKNLNETMVKDGTAMVKFLYWLSKNAGNEGITEISAADKLRNFRKEQEGFFDESFAPISAYNSHASMPHYSSSEKTNTPLSVPGIYLIDSGGQYFGGTTDITRSVVLGKATKRQKIDFTLALKGTINLAMAVFPFGTRGYQLDVIARQPLWNNYLNYGHGTGHGVGFFLNVHEGPQTIGTSASGDLNTILQPGMVISDEPAIYREGKYGFRTENLLLVVDDRKSEFGQFLKFETLTLCPIDKNLILKKLLDKKEKKWLNHYHKLVYSKISPYLSKKENLWLHAATSAL
ncbi:MAG: aminopeptidase P family N-terminal domain-containing protein [Bacteroidales bacterium]